MFLNTTKWLNASAIIASCSQLFNPLPLPHIDSQITH